MEKLNKTCLVCGKKYSYCNTCREFATLPRWKSLFDTENCKEIFHVTSDYLQGYLDEDIAKSRLNNCDLSNKNSFSDPIKKAINKLVYAQRNKKKTESVGEEVETDSVNVVHENEND